MQGNNDDYNEKFEATRPSFWPGESETLNWTDVVNYLPADYIFENLAESGLDIILETMTVSELFHFMNYLWQINLMDQISGISLPPSSAASADAIGGAKVSAQERSAAATQLLRLIESPDLLNCLHALALGQPLRKRGAPVPVRKILRLLSTLVNEVVADADELLRESNDTHSYLFNRQDYVQAKPLDLEDRERVPYETSSRPERQRLTTSQAASGRPWSAYLPFTKGTKLKVEYGTQIGNFNIGKATVLERTPHTLRFELRIDKWDQFNVPETDAVIVIRYSKEGTGNRAVVVVNGERYSDKNATIRSGRKTRDIFMSIKLLGQQVDRISVTRAESGEVRLTFNTGGQEHFLILTKT